MVFARYQPPAVIGWIALPCIPGSMFFLLVGSCLRIIFTISSTHLNKRQTNKKLVIVGDDPWEKDYVRSLQSTSDPRVVFTGGVYGQGYAQLQKNAYLFVLPDEVGGTHPALVEAMGFGNCVLVNDTASNIEVVADAGFSYKGKDGPLDLARQLQMLLRQSQLGGGLPPEGPRARSANYRWESVVRDHLALYGRILGVGDEVQFSKVVDS